MKKMNKKNGDRTVLYPGSFDPITKGHVDIIMRLQKIFSKVIVLVADSTRKTYLFTSETRLKLIREALGSLSGVTVVSSKELTVDFARKAGVSLIARSARTVSDWEYEYALADANKKMNSKIETLFIMADPKYAFISSSLVREVAQYGGDTSPFVPVNVVKALKLKIKTSNKR